MLVRATWAPPAAIAALAASARQGSGDEDAPAHALRPEPLPRRLEPLEQRGDELVTGLRAVRA